MHRLVVVFLSVVFFSASAAAQTFPPPNPWVPIPTMGEVQTDAFDDVQEPFDIVGAGSDGASFLTADANFLYFRIRLDESPLLPARLVPASFGVLIDTDNDDSAFEILVSAEGISALDSVQLFQNTVQGISGSPNDQAELSVATNSFTTHGRVSLAASSLNGTPDSFIDFAVARADLVPLGLLTSASFRIVVASGSAIDQFGEDIVGGIDLGASLSDLMACPASNCGLLETRVDLVTPLDGAMLMVADTGLVGTGEPSSIVDIEIREDVSQFVVFTGSTATDLSGDWNLDFMRLLPSATYTIDVSQTAPLGSVSRDSHTVMMNSFAAIATVQTPMDGAQTNVTQPVICGTADPNVSVRIDVNPGGVSIETAADANGDWCVNLPTSLLEGTYNVDVTVVGATVSSVFEIDVSNPSITVDAPSDGTCIPTARPVFSGTISEGGMVRISIGATTYEETFGAPGMWEVTIDPELDNGDYTASITARDFAGNETSAPPRSFEVDDEDPVVEIRTPESGTVFTRADIVIVEGIADPDALVEIRLANVVFGSGRSDGTGDYRIELTGFPVGMQNMTATVTDDCGNTGSSDVVNLAIFGDAGDPDNDGLNNAEEVENGTDPNNPDTDGDGLQDGLEVHELGTDPTDSDTDDDGIDDGSEVAGDPITDPLNADTDGDGLIDGRELAAKTDPTDSDSDDDGVNDLEEIENGTDPNDANDPLPGLEGGLSGGSCSTVPSDAGSPWFVMVFLLLGNYRRRRK